MSEKKTLVLDRVLNAPRAALWRCWTEPALLEKWFCPKPWYVTDLVLELRAGGEFSSVMHGPDGEAFPNTGVILEAVPAGKLVFTDAFLPGWRPSGRPFMVAQMTFEDAEAGKTRYFARAMHWTEEAREEHEKMGFHEGWNTTTSQLEELARTL